jgi:Ca2+/H+ antiporter
MKLKDITLLVLSILGIIFPVWIIIYVMNNGMKDMNPETTLMIGTLIGIIVGEYKTVFGYWMGSSTGSKEKQVTIDKMNEDIKAK